MVQDHIKYEVEKILDKQVWYCCTEYLVKWMGYPEYDATWEPAANLKNSQDLIQEFEQKGTHWLPVRFSSWIVDDILYWSGTLRIGAL